MDDQRFKEAAEKWAFENTLTTTRSGLIAKSAFFAGCEHGWKARDGEYAQDEEMFLSEHDENVRLHTENENLRAALDVAEEALEAWHCAYDSKSGLIPFGLARSKSRELLAKIREARS